MKVFLTGGTGFIGGAVARRLRADGHEVVALVRSPSQAGALRALGCELVQGDLSSAEKIAEAAAGCGAAIHGAAIYEIGITADRAAVMRTTNVEGTAHALDGLIAAGIPRIVYVSTVGVFGNTFGRTVDETFMRNPADGFVSVYDETKYQAHQIALARIADGAPIVIVQPSGVYGPGDHSEVGETLVRAARGKLPAKVFTEVAMSMVHVDDVADGIVAALSRGKVGESYVLSGEATTMGELIDRAAKIGGKPAPKFTLPTGVLKALAPFGKLIGPAAGMPSNLRELIAASDGVSYLASHDKATAELGYAPRSLDEGLPSAL